MSIEFFDGVQITNVDIKKPTHTTQITKILRYVCKNLIKECEYETIITFFLRELSLILHADSACISIKTYHKNGKQYLKCINTYYDPKTTDKPLKIRGESVLTDFFGSSSVNGKYIVSNNLAEDKRMTSKDHPELNSFFSAPLFKSKDSSIGQVSFFRKGGGMFTIHRVSSVVLILDILGKIVALWKRGDLSNSQEIKDVATDDYSLDTKGGYQRSDAKNMFLATISHELRTPLNGIVGMVTMLMDAGPLNDKQKEYLDILIQCSHQLMNLMNNILDFNKLASGKLSLLKNPLNIEKAVQDSIHMIESKAMQKGLKIIIERDEIVNKGLPAVLGDQQRLTQILSNLISNSVKFTEKGFIKIRINAERRDDQIYDKKWIITFDIEDTGIGIPKAEQSNIFKVFRQASTNTNKVGTGLGLSIVKELVKLMGGKIKVKSEGIDGKGSVFTFYIIADEELLLSKVYDSHRSLLEKAKILIIDDRQEYRLQFTDMLYKWGCHPTALSSGEEALQYLNHNIPDIIMVDICMPYMSGVELAQEVRKKYQIPLIALSSIELKSGKSLFDHYMNKPVDQNTLFATVLKCLVKQTALPQSTSKSQLERKTKKARKDLKILVAEDDVNNCYTIKEMLRILGFQRVKCVNDGQKCVKDVHKYLGTDESYDVILMDIIMPIMDGIEATKHIRQFNSKPYIIITSAVVQGSDKERCQQIGVDGYLTKPILKENLNAVLSPLIED